jgi:hypothetical protein
MADGVSNQAKLLSQFVLNRQTAFRAVCSLETCFALISLFEKELMWLASETVCRD